MPKLRVFSGKEVVAILSDFGFAVVAQRGSHVKLKREPAGNDPQTLTVPLHDVLDKGTLKAIYRQALRYIPQEALRTRFYSG